jgi:hypothetical protein
MLVVHAYVDPHSQELRASVTFAADITEPESTTQLATSRAAVLELVRAWLDEGNAPGDGPVTAEHQDRENVVDRMSPGE